MVKAMTEIAVMTNPMDAAEVREAGAKEMQRQVGRR